MNELTQSLHSLLAAAPVYKTLMRALGGSSGKVTHVNEYIRPHVGDKVLDIGCGPAEIIEYMPDVDYLGVDLSEDYIAHAKSKYGKKGRFLCRNAAEMDPAEFETYDIVLATGLLHHLNDYEATELLKFAAKALKKDGRLVTLDGCFLERNQHPFDRWMLNHDRGKFVRTQAEYLKLAKPIFPSIKANVRSDMLRFPYTLIILECSLVKLVETASPEAGELLALR